jgi:hypothetical protein
MLLEQISKGFIRQFLKIRHPVARELLELVERVIVKGDQFAHDRPAPASQARGSMTTDGNRSGPKMALTLRKSAGSSPARTLMSRTPS